MLVALVIAVTAGAVGGVAGGVAVLVLDDGAAQPPETATTPVATETPPPTPAPTSDLDAAMRCRPW